MPDTPVQHDSADPLRTQARHRPRAVSLEDETRTWTYAALDRAADELAARLAESGVTPGSIIGAWVDPTPAGIASVHGVPRLGGVLAPGHTRWNVRERAAFLERLRPAAVISEPGPPPPGGDWTERRIELTALGGERLALFQPATPPPEPSRSPQSAHTLLWTSGSEGAPRMACLSLANQLHSAGASNRRLGLEADDGWLASLGLAHVGGLAIVMRTAVAGARLVLGPARFDPERVLRLLLSGKVTHASVVPAMLDQLLEAAVDGPPPDRLRCVLVGGDATPVRLANLGMERGWPLAMTYGLTEAASQVATAPPRLVRRKPGTVGPPLDGVKVRIVANGEIHVGGPTVMLGYIRRSGAPVGVRDGWIRTGDRGRLDDEGDLWITGRSASRIVTGGSNVDPAEVEGVLATHPRVRAAGVVGVPDDVWGERVAAVVVPRETAGTESRGLESELAAWARQRLSGARCPRTWIFVERLPRTATGKPDRIALRNLAEAAATSEDRPATG